MLIFKAMNEGFSRFNPQDVKSKQARAKQFGGSQGHALNFLLNYWEIKPTQYEARLQELVLKGVRAVSAFVPWSHVETDIYHSLKKFVSAAWAIKLHVRLFVMPELGVNYPNAGIPRDLLANISNLAVDRIGQVIYNYAAPNIFALPSFSSPEVLKRFGHYLIKIGSILGEVFTEAGRSDFCEVVVSNSLFNYYRTHGLKLGEHGDYSAAHVMAFRDFVDREYSSAPSADGDSEKFKLQLYEDYNRHRFFSHVEKLLREKTDMVFARKSSSCAVRHVNLFNPECDSDAAYQGILTELFDFHPSVQRYYEAIIAGAYRSEAIYLGNCGVFRRFGDQEKSFLILAALIHSGEVGLMAEDLFKLSPNFRKKLQTLMNLIDERKFVRQTRVTYVSASKFSMEPRSFKMLAGMAPGVLSVATDLDSNARHLSERLIFMDPRSVIRLIELAQLLSAAQAGKTIAIPAPMDHVANYAADALAHFEKFKKGRQPLKLNIGLPYQVYEYHLGQVVFYDPRIFWEEHSALENHETARFFQAMLGLAEVRALCGVSDRRVRVASYVSSEDSTQRLLFVINPTDEPIDAKLEFTNVVALGALPHDAPQGADRASPPLVGKTFELPVPPRGVLSMQLCEPSRSELEGEELVPWT